LHGNSRSGDGRLGSFGWRMTFFFVGVKSMLLWVASVSDLVGLGKNVVAVREIDVHGWLGVGLSSPSSGMANLWCHACVGCSVRYLGQAASRFCWHCTCMHLGLQLVHASSFLYRFRMCAPLIVSAVGGSCWELVTRLQHVG